MTQNEYNKLVDEMMKVWWDKIIYGTGLAHINENGDITHVPVDQPMGIKEPE